MYSDHSSTSTELPAGELAEAVAACRKLDRRLDMYYKFASPTARRFVELGFYSNHFGERTDPALYARCRDAIAPTLTETDILYLLRFESDPDTKAYLHGLLTQLHAPKPPAAPEPQPTPVSPKSTSKLRFPAKRKKKAQRRLAQRWSAGQDSSGGIFGPKTLAVLSVLSLVIVIGGIRAYLNDLRETETAQLTTSVDDDFTPLPDTQPKQQKKRLVSRPKPTVQTTTDLPVVAEAAPVVVAQTIEDLSPTNDTPVIVAKTSKKQKLVLTDGTRIRTHPDGTIEVPRTFSYAGAGLKKPFWIYDRQLEKSGRIEHEARAEKAARDKWKALYDEAISLHEQE